MRFYHCSVGLGHSEQAMLSAWNAAHCSYLPEPLDCMVFQQAMATTPSKAIKLLQRALGLSPTGVCGRETLDALHEEMVAGGIEDLCGMYEEELGYAE